MAGICDVPVIGAVCAAGEATATIITAPLEWIAYAIGQAASWLFQGVWWLFDTTTLVDLTSGGYIGVYNVIFGVGVLLMLIFFCLQLLTGLIRREPAALARAALGLGKSVLGSFLVITLTATLLEIVDQLCIGIVQAAGTTMAEMGEKIGLLIGGLALFSLPAPGAAAIITIFLGFLAICAACIVWFSLLIRKALILVAVVMAPIALSGMSWDATRGWFGKWAGFLLALILSKLVIVVVFLVAITQVNAPIDLDLSSIADPVAGIVLMFVAAFSPYMAYKLIAFAGMDMYHVMSAEQEAKQSLNRPLPIPGPRSADTAKKILGDNDDGGGSPVPGGGRPPHGSTAATSAGAESSTAAAGSTGTAGAGASGAGAAAGPVGLAVVAGATVVKGAVEAGPRLGSAVARAGEGHTGAAQEPQAAPPPQTTAPSPPGTPAPQLLPRTSPAPPAPSPAAPQK